MLDRAASCDLTVLLSTAQFTPKHSIDSRKSGQQHLFLRDRSNLTTLVVPVTSRRDRIRDTFLDPDTRWRDKLLSRFRMDYAKAPNIDGAAKALQDMLTNERLWGLGLESMLSAVEYAGFPLNIVSDSGLGVEHRPGASDWMLSICLAAGATQYVCGEPPLAYLDRDAFENAGIEIVLQNWQPIPYKQHSEDFAANLSWLDAYAWLGAGYGSHVRPQATVAGRLGCP
jgi:hypothetical protein